MAKYSQQFGTTRKPSSVNQPIPGRTDMVTTSDGAYAFDAGEFGQFERFLILGAEGGTYYASENKHAYENCQSAANCIKADGPRAVKLIVDVSVAGRAIKNDAAIFALALAAGTGNSETQQAALLALPAVCRIPTHWFQFAQTVQGFRGWGRAMQRAFAKLYMDRTPENLAYTVTKYPSRTAVEGDKSSVWNHQDLIRLSHPRRILGDAAITPGHNVVLTYITKGELPSRDSITLRDDVNASKAYEFLEVITRLKAGVSVSDAVALIEKYRLSWEHLPTELLSNKTISEALLVHMPPHAMVRQLGKLTNQGVIGPFSQGTKMVIDALSNTEVLKKARLHPASIFMAYKVYAQGRGVRGSLTWTADRQVLKALDDAFYATFNYLPPTNKNFLLAVDVSGSMDGSGGTYASWGFANCTGAPMVSPREASAVMAMVIARVEKNHHVLGFSHKLVDIPIGAGDSIDQVIAAMSKVPQGGTNVSLPIREAINQRWPVDAFVAITDNEVNAGEHCSQVLTEFRTKSGRDAKGIVMAMVANNRSVFDPKDPNSLTTVGFDTNAPRLVTGFAANWQTESEA